MREQPPGANRLKVVDETLACNSEGANEASDILEKVQFIGENYNFVQKEIQEIVSRSKANEQVVGQYRKDLQRLNEQLSKERAYAKTLIDECQQLKGSVYGLERRLKEALDKHASQSQIESDLRIELQKHKEMLASEQQKKKSLTDSTNELNELLRRSQSQTRKLTDKLVTLRERWGGEIKKLRVEKEHLQHFNQKNKRQYELISSRVQWLIGENQKLVQSNLKLEGDFHRKDKALEFLKSEIKKRQVYLNKRDNQVEQLQRDLQSLHQSREECVKEKTMELQEQIEKLKKLCYRMREEINSKESELINIRNKWQSWARTRLTEPEQKLQEMLRQNTLLRSQLEEKTKIQRTLSEQELRNQVGLAKIERLEDRISILTKQLDKSCADSERKKNLIEKLNLKNEELQSRNGDLQVRIRQLEVESQVSTEQQSKLLTEMIDKKDRQISELEDQINKSIADKRSLEREKVEFKIEQETQRDYADRLKLQFEETQKKIQELHDREVQISNYSRLVDEQKFKLRRFADELSEEIMGLQELNPIARYLEITKQEIDEVELQLSKTPALATERKTLEAHFEKLVRQRDMLQKSLRESRQALHKKAKGVKQICQRAVLIPLPPLPPKSEGRGADSSN